MPAKKLFASFVLLFGLIFVFLSVAYAKRLLPRVVGALKKTQGVTTSVKFRSDRNAVILTLSNLSIAQSINYTLTYTPNTQVGQQVSATITPSSQSQIVEEIIFGTCSAGICRYDTGIKNAKLVVTTNLKTGKKVRKTFILKV